MPDWHAQSIPQILLEFGTDFERGLTNDAASVQRGRYGDNETESIPVSRLSLLFLKQIASIPVLLLAVTAAVLWYSRHAIQEALAVSAILGFHVVWRFAQAIMTRHQLQSIRKRLDIRISVIRGGSITKIPPREVVPGDLLILNEGDYISADARIVEADSLTIDETPLFDSASAVQKDAEDLPHGVVVPPEKQRNMVFGGTYVIAGSGRAIVVKTGKDLELQKLDRQAPTPPEAPTEAEKQMRLFYNYFSLAGLIVAVLAVAITWGLNRATDVRPEWHELLLLGLGFAIASVPDGIALTARAILVSNAGRLLKKGVAIQRPNTLEELNNLTAICADDVGAFTKAGLALSHVFVDEQLIEQATWEQWLSELESASDNADATALPVPPPESKVPIGFPLLVFAASRCASNRRYQRGDSVDEDVHAALKEVALRIGYDLDRYHAQLPLVAEIPDTPDHPYKGFVFKTETGKYLEIILGKPETLLHDCRSIQNQGLLREIDPDQATLIRQVAEHLRQSGAHVFGIAHRTLRADDSRYGVKRRPVFLGLAALSKSAHENARESVQFCMDAGIKIVMITDEDRQTAIERAKQMGITQDINAVAESADLDSSGEDYDSVVSRCLVYCKVSAAHRLKILQYLGRHGLALGFLGRRPRDMRAIKVADVSFASASYACHAVQRYASCLMLKEGFAVIGSLLHHSRQAYNNLVNSMRWLLSCTLAQLVTLVAGFALHQLYGLPMPLSLPQIIWIHLLVNLVPLMHLGRDQIRESFRHRSYQTGPPFPHKPYRADILRGLFLGSSTIAGFLLTIGITPGNWAQTETVAQTTTCTILIFSQLLSNFRCRRYPWESLLQRIAANLPLLVLILLCMGLHATVIYLEPAANIFGVTSLRLQEWQWVGAFCVLAALQFKRHTVKKPSTH